MKTIAARSSPISAAKAAGSRALPHKTRWRPRSHRSPILLTGGPAGTSGSSIGRIVVGLGRVLERCDPQIDLGHLEAGDLDVEIEAEQRKILELLGEQPVVPGGDFGQAVVGDHEGAGLRRGEVIEAQGRHLGQAELAAGQQPAVPGDDVAVAIDQDRDIEAEGLDAVGDLPDLLFAVTTGINGVRLKLIETGGSRFSETWRRRFPPFSDRLWSISWVSPVCRMILHTGILEFGEPLEFRKRRKF